MAARLPPAPRCHAMPNHEQRPLGVVRLAPANHG